MNNEIYTNLNDCINDVLSLSSNYACEGVEKNIGGPFGAGIIQKLDNGYKIICIERNTVISSKDATSHAEINAIRKASKFLNRRNLNDCILVTTAKSCPMCLSASCWANIPVIYYSVDYSEATASGFRDDAIAEYIKGNNTNLINELQVKNDICCKPFKIWNNKKDKMQY